MSATDSRTDGARRLGAGAVAIPYNVVVMVIAIVVAIPLWLINGIWQIVVGSPLLAENSRIGYILYTAQANIQAAVTGRGDLEWWYFTR